jgi:hypothetical protein
LCSISNTEQIDIAPLLDAKKHVKIVHDTIHEIGQINVGVTTSY